MLKEAKKSFFIRKNKHKKAALLLAMTVFTSIVPNINVIKAADEGVNTTIVTVDPTIHYQTMDGWGTSLAWWANMVGGWTMPGKSGQSARDELMELVFDSDKGLGLNIVRYNVGGGDDPTHNHIKRIEAEVPGYKATEQSDYNWDADANQVWVLEQAIAKRQASGDIITEMFSNTPPYWMTVSGCASGNTDASKDNLKTDYYDDFAKYLVDVAKYFKDTKHITFDYLEPINEPASSYWKANSTKQEGCHFDQGASQNEIYTEVYNELQQQGLSNDIDLTGTDETSIDVAIESFRKLNDSVKGNITKINPHTYGGSKRVQIRDLAKSYDKKLWMSEVCYGDEATSFNSMKTALQLSGGIQKDLKDMKANAWVVWQAVESHLENLRLKNSSGNWGLIQGVYEDTPVSEYHIYADGDKTAIDMNALGLKRGDYFVTKQYYTMGQYSKFIKKGYTLVECDNENTVAALSPNGDELVLVAQNPNSSSKNFSFYLSNLNNISSSVQVYRTSETESLSKLSNASISNSKYLNTVLPANSVTTYIIEANSGQKLYNYGTSTLVNDNVTGTGENQFSYSAGWESYDKQLGAYSSDVHYSNTANSTYTFKFIGTKAKIYGSMSPDGGVTAVSIDNEPEVTFDTYSSQRKESQMLYATPVLTAGEHTIKVRVTGTKNDSSSDSYIATDYVQPINGDLGAGDSAPVLKELKAWDKKLIVKFRTVEGAASYKVKYGIQSGDYTEVLEDVTSDQAVINNLVNGTTYYVAVSAMVNGTESVVSNELFAVPQQVNVSGSLYYVDAGSPVPTQLMNSGEEFGLNNSNTDQPYGVDPITGSKWGYITTNGTWAKTDGNQFDTLRCDTSDTAFGHITYKFEVPNGTYNVALGFKDPWSNAGRKMDIIIEGDMKQAAYVTPNGTNDTKSYQVQVTDGELEVKVRRSTGVTGGGEDPHISWILINPEGKKSIISVSENQVVTHAGKAPKLPLTAEVKYSDETSEQKTVTWDTVMSSQYAEAFENFYVEGSIEGTTLKAKVKVNVVPANVVYYIDGGAQADNKLFNAVREAVPALLNTVPDQAYDGKWGYVENDTGAYNHTDEFNSVRYANSATLTYQMPITNGNYTVNFGFYDPWGNYNRTSDIEVEGTLVEKGMVVQQAKQTKSYSGVEVSDGMLDITIRKTSGTSQNPIVSWIMVSSTSQTGNEPKTIGLSDIILSEGTLTPQFDPQQFNYSTSVAYNVDNITVSARTTDSSIILNDITTDSGITITGLGSKALIVGDNTISIVTTSEDGITIKTYTIIVTREMLLVIPVTDVVLDKTTASVKEGQNVEIKAIVNPADATNKEVTWSSSDEAVATVNPAGKVTGVKAGTATITVTTTDGSFKAECLVTVEKDQVTEPEIITATGVTLNSSASSVKEGRSTQLTATITPSNATNKEVTWSTSDSAVATVDQTGEVTGVKVGTATITVTTKDGNFSAQCTITVKKKSSGSGNSGSDDLSTTVPTAPVVPTVPDNTTTEPVVTTPSTNTDTDQDTQNKEVTEVSISLANGKASKDGVNIQLTVKPYVEQGRTMAGIRDVASILQIESKNIVWNNKNKEVIIKTSDKEIKLILNQKYAIVNGKKIDLDVTVQMKDGRTVLPIAQIARLLDVSVQFNTKTKDITFGIKK